MKIATWNVNSLKVRLPHLLDWLATTQTDVVVRGKFQGNRFIGTIQFPADGEQPAREASLTLSR